MKPWKMITIILSHCLHTIAFSCFTTLAIIAYNISINFLLIVSFQWRCKAESFPTNALPSVELLARANHALYSIFYHGRVRRAKSGIQLQLWLLDNVTTQTLSLMMISIILICCCHESLIKVNFKVKWATKGQLILLQFLKILTLSSWDIL